MKRKVFLSALLLIFCFLTKAQNNDTVLQRTLIGYINKQEVLSVLPEAVQFEVEYSQIKAEYEQQFDLLTEE